MYHQFVGSKAPWYEILDDLPQHDTRPAADNRSAAALPIPDSDEDRWSLSGVIPEHWPRRA